LIKTIDLPGTKGGHGDWVTYDPDTETIWLSQAPDHNVVVIDANKLSVKATISGIDVGNGIDINKTYAFIADATPGKLVVVNKRTFKKVASVDSGGKTPDGVTIDTRTGKVFVANDDSNNEAVFESKPPFRLTDTFKLKPEDSKDGPDVALYVHSLDRLYQPVGGNINVIDPNTNKILAVWDFGGQSDAKGGIYDSKTNHVIFGTGDKKMLVVDGASGKLVTTIPIAGAVDQTVRFGTRPPAVPLSSDRRTPTFCTTWFAGQPAATTADEAMAQLGNSVSVYLDAGPCPGDLPSTIVDLTGSVPRLLRPGVISVERLQEVVPLALAEDEVPEEAAPEDDAPEDEGAEDEVPGDEGAGGEVPEDEVPEDEAPEGHAPAGEAAEDAGEVATESPAGSVQEDTGQPREVFHGLPDAPDQGNRAGGDATE